MINKLRIIFTFLLCSLFINSSAFAFDATLKHEYTFRDLWDATTPVQDNVGNSDGIVVGSATRILDADNFLGQSTSCSVADFNNGYILLDNLGLDETDGAKTSVTFWLKWGGNVDDESNRQMPFSWNTYDLLFRGSDFGFNSFEGDDDSADNIYGINTPNNSNFLSKNGNNSWVHIAAVFTNGDIESNTLYVNGDEQILTGNIGDSAFMVIAQQMTIGGHVNGISLYPINGRIGNFRIYDGEITTEQVTSDIADIDEACSDDTDAVLIHQYTFSDLWNATTEVLDSVGNSDGSVVGGTTRVIDTDNFLGQSSSCTVADFNEGTINLDSLGLNTDSGDTTSITFWMKWNGIENQMPFSWNTYSLWLREDGEVNGNSSGNAEIINFGFNSFRGNIYGISSTPSDLANTWVHIAAVFRDSDMGNNQLYINGVLQDLAGVRIGNSGDGISNPNAQILQELALGGNNNTSVDNDFYFEGRIGNFRIYDGELAQEQVLTDMNDISEACNITNPILDMRFDEISWNGTDTVLDSSGNNYHGTAFETSPVDGLLSCNAADFTAIGTSDYISVANDALNGLTDFTIIFWGKMDATHTMAAISGARIGQSNEVLYFLDGLDDGTLRTRGFLHGSSRTYRNDIIFDNQWHQFAWTRDLSTNQGCMYRDGELIECEIYNSSSALSVDTGGFIVGQEQDSLGGRFVASQAWDGLIDELLIFPSVLNQVDIELYRTQILAGNDWQGIPKVCGNSLDHYRFELPNNGLTCVASDIVLKACENESCSSVSSESISLTLSPSGQWGGNDISNDVVSFITGTASLELSQPTADTVNIDITSFTSIPTSANPIQCYVGSTNTTDSSLSNCSLLFKDTGFLFNTIPTQISNKPSSEEFNKQTLTIQAVETDNETGACQAVFPENGSIDIELKLNCVGGECSDIEITTGSGATSQTVGDDYNNVSFLFDDDSLASYELTYPNAGQLSFSAQKTDVLTSGAVLSGTSNNFVVKPFGFKFEFVDATNAASIDALFDGDFDIPTSVYTAAGNDFSVNAIAIGWQANEDINLDGKIDDDANSSNNATVQFFSGESVQLTHELLAPSGGVSGTLIASDMMLNNSSASFTDASWSEVGVISLTASLVDNDYLGSGDVTGTVGNVGRFTPDHFDTSDIVAGELTGQCASQTFIGELTSGGLGALTYGALNPTMTLTAKNSNGDTTLNYRDDFFRFGTAIATFDTPSHIDGTNILIPSSLTVTGANSVGTVAQKTNGAIIEYGQFIYTAPDSDHFVYTRDANSQVAEFAANIQYLITSLIDIDAIGVVSTSTSPMLTAISTTIPEHKMVYGRVALINAFGPENETVALPIEHQAFNGTEFIINTNINNVACPYPVVPNTAFTLSPMSLGTLNLAALPNSLSWTDGEASLLMPAPGTQGNIEFTLDVESWLQYDWDNDDSTNDTNPTATATFGRYRGNDRIINWRENR